MSGSTGSNDTGTYSSLAQKSKFLVQAMEEGPGATVKSVANAGGHPAVKALIDVILDSGHRMVLVKALNSPAIEGWVRETIENTLYGCSTQSPALFRYLH